MVKVQKPSRSECYAPPWEPFRLYSFANVLETFPFPAYICSKKAKVIGQSLGLASIQVVLSKMLRRHGCLWRTTGWKAALQFAAKTRTFLHSTWTKPELVLSCNRSLNAIVSQAGDDIFQEFLQLAEMLFSLITVSVHWTWPKESSARVRTNSMAYYRHELKDK
jgi:hypothetical protein